MKKYLIACSFLLLSLVSYGTHLRAGFIRAERINASALTYKITITVYTNTKNTPVLLGGDADISYISFGDGERAFVPETANTIRYDLNPDGEIATASFSVIHTYSTIGSFVISYAEPNRNAGILNMANSVATLFYVESLLVIDPFLPISSSPSILAEPLFKTSMGEEFTCSMAASDSTDQSLFYDLITPASGHNTPVVNYQLPENFSINKLNGSMSWDTKFHNEYRPGEYAFAVKISQYAGNYLNGYMIVDFQVILEDGENGASIADDQDLDENGRTFIESGSSKKFKILAEYDAADSMKLKAFSELKEENISFTSYDSIEGDRKIKVGILELKSDNDIVRDNPYAVVIRGYYYVQPGAGPDLKHDIGYLFYTKDTQLEVPEVILGVGEEERLISVYPNPTNDFIFLDKRVKSARLITHDGKQLFVQDCSDKPMMDLTGIKPGTYFLQMNTRNNHQNVVRIVRK